MINEVIILTPLRHQGAKGLCGYVQTYTFLAERVLHALRLFNKTIIIEDDARYLRAFRPPSPSDPELSALSRKPLLSSYVYYLLNFQ